MITLEWFVKLLQRITKFDILQVEKSVNCRVLILLLHGRKKLLQYRILMRLHKKNILTYYIYGRLGLGLDGLAMIMTNIISPHNTLWHNMVGYRMNWKEPNQLLITFYWVAYWLSELSEHDKAVLPTLSRCLSSSDSTCFHVSSLNTVLKTCSYNTSIYVNTHNNQVSKVCTTSKVYFLS